MKQGSVEKCRRACAGAPGLRSRSYFGGVGSANSLVRTSERCEGKCKEVAEGCAEQFDSCHVILDTSPLTIPGGLATGNGMSHAGAGRATNAHLFEHPLRGGCRNL
jgi:hypothetical protein